MICSPKPIIFLGPTLKWAEAGKLCEADFRPPAAMGDITRAACGDPDLIVLIDGVFEDGPSVWHKEILWAMSKGIAMIGASSMGALRAAELASFGMLGYGEIYEDFAAGRLTDDDEVAVVHGPRETGWMPLTDSMVDIRHAVTLAEGQRLLDEVEAARVIDFCKSRYFKQRSLFDALHAILPAARTAAEIGRILDWFNSGICGAKEADCRSLLTAIDTLAMVAHGRLRNTPPFIPTIYLERLRRFGFNHVEQVITW